MSSPSAQALRRTSYRQQSRLMGAADIETEGFLGKWIIGRVRHADDRTGNFYDAKSFFQFLLDTPRGTRKHRNEVIWMHNGAGFDFPRLVAALYELLDDDRYKCEFIAQGYDKIIACVIHVGTEYRVTLADSFALLPSSLDKITKSYAPEMPKLPHCKVHDFEKGKWFDPRCDYCMQYLEHDVDGLLLSIQNLERGIWRDFRAPLGLTASGTALKAARAAMPKGLAYYPLCRSKMEFVRQAVGGGFVWPGHKRGNRGPAKTYDRSGAYAHQLRQGVPYGNACWRRLYREDLPGIWDVTVTVPHDIPIPIIRGPQGGPGYPTGTFRTVCTSLEIGYAEKLGCKFEIHRGVTWDRWEYPFNEFIDKCERMEYPPDGSEPDPAVKQTVKLMRNGLPGKFAAKTCIVKYHAGVTPVKGSRLFTDPSTGQPLPFYATTEVVEDGSYSQPHWNAFITARQRIDTHRVLMAGGEASYYADTDSATWEPCAAARMVVEGVIETGIGYGKYHPEGDWAELHVGGPKNKAGILLIPSKDGKLERTRKQTVKGIPGKVLKPGTDLHDANWQIHLDAVEGRVTGEVQFESVYSFKARLKRPGEANGEVRKRKFSTLEESESWMVDEAGNIRPRPIE